MTESPVYAGSSGPERERELHAILRRAHLYEVGPLVCALERVGIPLSRIAFDGRPPKTTGRNAKSPVRLAPRGRLVVAARLRDDSPPERVVIYLAVGLFGAASPLPTYFQKLLAGEVLAETLGDLLHVLDDSLWRARVGEGYAPRRLFPRTATDPQLAEACVGSDPVYVDWLFRQVFPELRVEVTRGELPRAIKLDSVFLGHVALGQCALSGHTSVPTDALVVTLTAAFDAKRGAGEYRAGRGETWMEEIGLRLRRDVFPVFERHPMSLRVVLRVLASRTQSKVEQARLGEALVVKARAPFEFTLFTGVLGATAR